MDETTVKLGLCLSLEEVFQPWELDGVTRRDARRHRGRLLQNLARLSLFAGGLTFVCLVPCVYGLPLAIVTWIVSQRDLDRICAGSMDQEGYHPTQKARSDSHAAIWLNVLGLLFWCLLPATAILLYLLLAPGFLKALVALLFG
jgi:hypothetical protein